MAPEAPGTSEMSPELLQLVRSLCRAMPAEADAAASARLRAAQQIRSYLQVLRLRLQKDHLSAEALAGEHESMLFVQRLRTFSQEQGDA